MKIPTVDNRFDIASGQLLPVKVDLLEDLRKETIAVLSITTQCESNVVFGTPVKVRSVAGFHHWEVTGEFSSGDAYGEVKFTWSVRQESPEFYDVMTVGIKMGEYGWCDVDYRGDNMFMEQVEQEYRAFRHANKFVPRKYPEIEAILDEIRKEGNEKVTGLADRISQLIGNPAKVKENGK